MQCHEQRGGTQRGDSAEISALPQKLPQHPFCEPQFAIFQKDGRTNPGTRHRHRQRQVAGRSPGAFSLHPTGGLPCDRRVADAVATLFRDLKDQQEIRVLKPALRAAKEYAHYVAKPLPRIDRYPNGSGKLHITIFDGLGIKLPIKRVIVGPSAHQAPNAALARGLVGSDRVMLSQIPPRVTDTAGKMPMSIMTLKADMAGAT